MGAFERTQSVKVKFTENQRKKLYLAINRVYTNKIYNIFVDLFAGDMSKEELQKTQLEIKNLNVEMGEWIDNNTEFIPFEVIE